MLTEARSRCAALGLGNVRLAQSDDRLSNIPERFDLINSYIVLQHITCRRGEAIVEQLLDRLQDGGVGVLHLTYHRQTLASPSPRRPWRALLPVRVLRDVAHGLTGRWGSRRRRKPEPQMNCY